MSPAFNGLVLHQATALASRGKLREAEGVLAAIGEAASSLPEACALRARIFYQRGELAEARRWMEQATRTAPENVEYRAALRALSTRPRGGAFRQWALVGAAAAVLVTTGVAVSRWREGSSQTPPVAAAGDPSPTVVPPRESREVTFSGGLFRRGTQFTQSGRADLEAVAAQLASAKGPLELEIIGHTDSVPLAYPNWYADQRALALARADAVARVLMRATGTPAERVLTSANNPGHFLTGNATEPERARNRTVRIIVRSAAR